jgi:hypothetical protein
MIYFNLKSIEDKAGRSEVCAINYFTVLINSAALQAGTLSLQGNAVLATRGPML